MRTINPEQITEAVELLLVEANYHICDDVYDAIKKAKENEESEIGKEVLEQIIENDWIATTENVPMCQDTGIVVVFLEVGNEVFLDGNVYDAINLGVHNAYNNAYLRKSVVKHPFDRVNTQDNTPAIIHTKITQGEQVKITVAAKGAGSENMSTVKMLTPAEGYDGVKKLVLDTVFDAKGKPCPPIIVGLGIGGDLEKAAIIAKESLMRDLDDESSDPIAAKLERELLEEINQLGVGPMGFGGTQTALAVKVNTFPCHIASLPVAINIQCHAARHKSKVI
ncbi:fumarate hydratase [Haloplasma contractile]|uniref:Fumarate hydratase subunit alpha protein n=1 Tax=Haloplasma contractile SSD-17B TaxID=1033810 RepID=F7PSZ1_9MOLU|nr:fumarate hydratase [Haloplasma contractile]ERJ12597.1 fumarate hydratase subunit alpha protein [Haloplasma contractile SSD-17B]